MWAPDVSLCTHPIDLPHQPVVQVREVRIPTLSSNSTQPKATYTFGYAEGPDLTIRFAPTSGGLGQPIPLCGCGLHVWGRQSLGSGDMEQSRI